MHPFLILLVILQLLPPGYTATPCKRDACYSAVAIQGPKSPNLVTRRADCSSVLKLFVDTDVTTTITSFTVAQTPVTLTIFVTKTTITETITSTASIVVKRHSQETSSNAYDTPNLEVRDTFVIQGKRPSYAQACQNIQHYALACLCFGVKAAVQKTIVHTRRVTATLTQTTTLTASKTATETTTLVVPRTTCDDSAQCGMDRRCLFGKCVDDHCPYAPGGCLVQPKCGPGGLCECFQTDLGNRCILAGECGNEPCNTSSDCTGDGVCVIDSCCPRPFCRPSRVCQNPQLRGPKFVADK